MTHRPSLPLTLAMTLLAALVVAFASTVALADDATHGERVARASRAFRDATAVESTPDRRAAFARSAELFERALDGGRRNGALEYNAGNAWFLAGDLGRAVLHYRRGLRLRPGDPRIEANLATARARRPDRFEATSARALTDTLLFWHRGLSLRTKVPLALGAWVLGFGLLALGAWLPRRARGRRGSVRTGGFVLVVAVAVGVSAVVEMSERASRDAAVVLADEVALRTGDGQSYPERYENPIHSGLEVRIRETRAGWVEIELPDGKSGWLPADALERI